MLLRLVLVRVKGYMPIKINRLIVIAGYMAMCQKRT